MLFTEYLETNGSLIESGRITLPRVAGTRAPESKTIIIVTHPAWILAFQISQVSPSKLPHLGRAFTDIQEQKQAPCPFTGLSLVLVVPFCPKVHTLCLSLS